MKIKTTLKKFNSAFVTTCSSHLQLIFERLFIFRSFASVLISFSVLLFFFRFSNQFLFCSSYSSFFRLSMSFFFLFSNSFFLDLRVRLLFDLRILLFFDFRVSILLDLWNFRILLMNFFLDLWIFWIRSSVVLWKCFFFLIMFYVAISKFSNKKKRVEFLNMFENVSFFRDAKMSKNDAKIKDVKKNINFCDIKNLNQFEINFFKEF